MARGISSSLFAEHVDRPQPIGAHCAEPGGVDRNEDLFVRVAEPAALALLFEHADHIELDAANADLLADERYRVVEAEHRRRRQDQSPPRVRCAVVPRR